MSLIQCGTGIRNGAYPPGTAGCLVYFEDYPQRVMLLSAGHVLVPNSAKQNDPIYSSSDAELPLGRLRTWSGLFGSTTVDAALVWIDPSRVSPDIAGLGGPPAGVNVKPAKGDLITLFPMGGGAKRTTNIADLNFAISMSVWGARIPYCGQILCTPSVSNPGDSGAMAFDQANNIVGMLVGGSSSVGDLITPIDAILAYEGWNGFAKLAAQMPTNAIGPDDVPTAKPGLARTQFSDLQQNYETLFAAAKILPARADQVASYADRVRAGRATYEQVSAKTAVPWWFIGIVHGLETGFNFASHIHNGDPLSSRTVHVPAGRPPTWNPPTDWVSSAIDSMTFEGFANQSDWTLARSLYRLEGYNGYGYYAKGINSPYLWSFSNQYTSGKFVADHRYDPNAVSQQCGAAVALKSLVQGGDVILQT